MPTLTAHIAGKIRELRTAAKLTQSELARALKLTPNTVSRWESETYRPSVEDLDRLARYFGKPIWAFFPNEVQPEAAKHRALLRATADLPPSDIEELVRYAEFVRARGVLQGKKK